MILFGFSMCFFFVWSKFVADFHFIYSGRSVFLGTNLRITYQRQPSLRPDALAVAGPVPIPPGTLLTVSLPSLTQPSSLRRPLFLFCCSIVAVLWATFPKFIGDRKYIWMGYVNIEI